MNHNSNAAYGNAFFDEFEEALGGNVILKVIRGIGHLLGKMLTAIISRMKTVDRKVSEFLMGKENDPARKDREMMSRCLMRKW